jgi:dTDP-glucose 4,6-dehydratase
VQAGDVRDFDGPDGTFDLVVHGAASSDPRTYAGDPLSMYDTIAGGTRRALEFAVNRRAKRFLFVSSGAVYGPQPPSLSHVPESYPGGPDPMDAASLYGEAKRAAEVIAARAGEAAGLHVTSARCFAFVGPLLPLDWHFAVGNFIRDALRGGPIRIQGDGSPWRSYMYPTDLVPWLVAILLRGGRNRAYNVGSEDGVSVGGLAAAIGAMTGVDIEIARPPHEGAPPNRYVPDVSRARSELGVVARVQRDEALARTLRFHGWRGAE